MDLKLHTGQPVPPRLIKTVQRWDQEALTPDWLDSLPETVARLCRKWSIELDPVIPETDITLVLLGHSTKLGLVVIKSSPLAGEFLAEATALKLAAQENVAKLFDLDLDRSAMVIERIMPGMQLRKIAMTDADATRLAAETAATFWRPVADPAGLHPMRHWMRALFDWPPDSDLIPADLIAQAQEIGLSLLGRSTRSLLLHGDFQHHNLLQRASGAWTIIDPKGLYGDPAFEVVAWMYNPPGVTLRDDYRELVAQRLAIFAEVWRIDERELLAWSFVGMVLSACWATAGSASSEQLSSEVIGARHLQAVLQQFGKG